MHDGARLLGPNGAEQLTSLGRGQLDEFHPPSRYRSRAWEPTRGSAHRRTKACVRTCPGTAWRGPPFGDEFPPGHYHVVGEADPADNDLPEP
jgi:hypothetical protein